LKKILLPLLLLATLTAFNGCSTTSIPPDPTPGPVSLHGRLHTDGHRIVGADGRPVSLAGVSFGWSQWQAARFYNQGVVNWLKQDWHAGIVRAALGIDPKGYLNHPEVNQERVVRVIDAAIADDLYVIIDWHDHQANEHPALAVAFFTEMARRYGTKPNIIYEIFNEPFKGLTWARDVKPYAEQVVAAIRAVDPANLIVVGTSNFSQDVDIAAADPIKDANLAYTLHFYAGTHKQRLRDNGKIDAASTEAWMAFMREWQLSHCNWAVYDKAETASILLPSAASRGPWRDEDLSPSGRYARTLIRAWPAPPAP
jgi:endoglucanase